MARPILPTPPLVGDDAQRLIDDLHDVASPEEIRERMDRARRELAQVMGNNMRTISRLRRIGFTPR